MNRSFKSSALLLAIALVAAACTQGDNDAVSPAPTSTSIPDTSSTVELVECDDAPSEAAILCEAYGLISRHYAGDVGDDELAAAARRGVLALDGAPEGLDLVCPLPTPSFSVVCSAWSGEVESNSEGAEAAVMGMTQALDVNSVYLDADALALVEEEQIGQIQGIGALVSADEEGSDGEVVPCAVLSSTCVLTIVSTIAGGPAERAGVLRGDVVVSVDGRRVENRTIDEVTAKVRGEAGTTVTIGIERDGTRLEFQITRAAVSVPVVEWQMVDGSAYLRLNLFTDNSDEQVRSALEGLMAQSPEMLVVDLRDNPGGLLDAAVSIASQFLEGGEVVVTQSPTESIPYAVISGGLVPPDLPLVVLMNGGSASASEVVAAVLQERGRATIVGEPSFGKNTVQQRFNLSNGGGLKLTVARWLTPGGHDFGDIGVIPDVEQVFDPAADVPTLVAGVLVAAG